MHQDSWRLKIHRKNVWCSGKGWVISASKSDGCFWFNVVLLLRLNSIYFFLFFFFCLSFSFAFLFLCYFLLRLEIILLIIYLILFNKALLNKMISSISTSFDWSLGAIYRVYGLRLGLNFRVPPAPGKNFYLRLTLKKMLAFAVFTKKCWRSHRCSGTNFTAAVNHRNADHSNTVLVCTLSWSTVGWVKLHGVGRGFLHNF